MKTVFLNSENENNKLRKHMEFLNLMERLKQTGNMLMTACSKRKMRPQTTIPNQPQRQPLDTIHLKVQSMNEILSQGPREMLNPNNQAISIT